MVAIAPVDLGRIPLYLAIFSDDNRESDTTVAAQLDLFLIRLFLRLSGGYISPMSQIYPHPCASGPLPTQMGFAESRTLQDRRLCVQAAAYQGDYEQAIALLDVMLEQHEGEASDYNNRGLMHFRLQNYDLALADYHVAIALDPRLDSAYNNRANCYVAQGYLAEAIADYQIALDFNPGNLHAWINQGITYRDLGIYDLAIENFDLVLIIGSRLKGRVYGERGRTYHLRGDWNLALADYQRALDKLSNSFSSRRDRRTVEKWREELLNPIKTA
jgi:tetratricopeptide (TPR) repeat protein